MIYLNHGWSLYPSTLEKEYNLMCSEYSDVRMTTIGKDIPCCHTRFVDGKHITYFFFFMSSPYHFEFDVTCDLDDEEHLLKELQVVLDSVRLKKSK